MVGGATCSGKTALAVELAEHFGAEVISADSRQVYRGMPIGTAMPSEDERRRARHHLIDFLDPLERYSAARFVSDALRVIAELRAAGKRAIVAGGTGFYIRALCGDVQLSDAYDEELRTRLAHEARLHPPEVLHAWLAARDAARAARVAPGDRYRVVRALEVALALGHESESTHDSLRSAGIPFVKLVLEVDPATLEARIATRADAMLRAGFVEEAERIGAAAVAADAVGYQHALAYAAGRATFEELREAVVRATRRYAKRQRTWFRREPGTLRVEHTSARSVAAREAREMLGWE